jgi:hypothetical protein
MKSRTGYTPTTDGEKVAWAGGIYTECVANASQWNLPEPKMAEFQSLNLAAKTAFDVNSDTSARSHKTVVAKDAAIEKLMKFLSPFVTGLEINEAVSDEDLAKMKLRPRHPHHSQPAPAPTSGPEISVDIEKNGIVHVYIQKEQRGEPTDTVDNKKVHGYMFYTQIAGGAVQKTPASRNRIEFTYPLEDAGKELTVYATKMNSRDQEGPRGNVVSVIIPK